MGKLLLSKIKKNYEKPLLWFFIISLLIHHMVLTLLINLKKPPELKPKTLKVKIFQIHDFEPAVPAVLKMEMVSLKFEEKKKNEMKVEEKKKNEEKEKKELKKEVKLKSVKGLHYVDIRNNRSEKAPQNPRFFAPQNSIVNEETRAQNTNLDRDDGRSEPEQSGIEDKMPGNANDKIAAHKVKKDKK
jgi:hypothetical protein